MEHLEAAIMNSGHFKWSENFFHFRICFSHIRFWTLSLTVTLVGACDDELVAESNEKFDEYFEEYGEIKSPTKLDKYPEKWKNGLNYPNVWLLKKKSTEKRR